MKSIRIRKEKHKNGGALRKDQEETGA